jgi:hypothetical protein
MKYLVIAAMLVASAAATHANPSTYAIAFNVDAATTCSST